MSYIVIITFDIKNPTRNAHGEIQSYREILNQVKELDFYKIKKGKCSTLLKYQTTHT
jgi:hypothetical protein